MRKVRSWARQGVGAGHRPVSYNSLHVFNLKMVKTWKRIIVHDGKPNESSCCVHSRPCLLRRLPACPRARGGRAQPEESGRLLPRKVCVHLAANGTRFWGSARTRTEHRAGQGAADASEQLEERSWDRSCGGTPHGREGSTTERELWGQSSRGQPDTVWEDEARQVRGPGDGACGEGGGAG